MIAIGGNSLIKDKQHQSVRDQYVAAGETCWHIAGMIKDGWDVAVTHGNGPQVGFILRRSELAAHEMHEVPLDVIGADTQGAIGYALQQNLENDFARLGLDKHAVTVVTQTEVDPNDPAFQSPSKPIGSYMEEPEALRRRDQERWAVMEDAGRGWRRVVASPKPIRIVEELAIKELLDAGYVVISAGGGGIPVIRNAEGNLTPEQRWVDRMTLSEAKRYLDEGTHFAKGSMAPKIEAVVAYLERGGGEAIITNPGSVERALAGETGTHIVPG